MSLKLLPITAFTLLLLVVPCRGASKKTIVDGHHLENTAVGLYGFAVDIPPDYEPYDPPTEKNFTPRTHPDLAWFRAYNLDRKAGFSTNELIPFQNKDIGLVVAVTATTLQIPPVQQEKEHLRFLDMFTSWAVRRRPGDFLRDTRKIGDIQVGRVGSLYQGTVTAANFVLIPPATVLTFYGACPEADKDHLLADLDRVIATLNIGKRTLP